MTTEKMSPVPAPIWNLYGEAQAFPDVMHIERIRDRAAGLDWVIAPHRHAHLHQFFLLTAGEVRFSADGEVMNLTAPFVLSVPAGVIHGFAFSAQAEGQVLTLPLPNFSDVLGPSAPFSAPLSSVAILPASGATIGLFADIFQEYIAGRLGRTTMLRALSTQLIARVARALPQGFAAQSQGVDPRVAAFEAMVQTHLRDGRRVADFAAELGLSARHLSRLCHRARGVPATKLIEATLLREACRMLVYTRMSVASVAYGLGFQDASYFSRAFKRSFGLTPNAYRATFESG